MVHSSTAPFNSSALLLSLLSLLSFLLVYHMLTINTQTVGVEFSVKTVNIPETNYTVELYLFDCSGQDIYADLIPRYVCFLVFLLSFLPFKDFLFFLSYYLFFFFYFDFILCCTW